MNLLKKIPFTLVISGNIPGNSLALRFRVKRNLSKLNCAYTSGDVINLKLNVKKGVSWKIYPAAVGLISTHIVVYRTTNILNTWVYLQFTNTLRIQFFYSCDPNRLVLSYFTFDTGRHLYQKII